MAVSIDVQGTQWCLYPIEINVKHLGLFLVDSALWVLAVSEEWLLPGMADD